MLDVVYRFRSSEKLLKFKELELLQIYLAPPHQLNDPMEGYKNVVMRGDPVLWENLVRHYLLAVAWTIPALLVGPQPFVEPRIPASLTEDDLPTDAFRAIYTEACDEFFRQPAAPTVVSALGSAPPLRRDTLRAILSMITPSVLFAVSSVMTKHGLMPTGAQPPWTPDVATSNEGVVTFIQTLARQSEDDVYLAMLAANHLRQEAALRALLQLEDSNEGRARRVIHFLLFAFSDRYVDGVIEELVYPPWRTACFSATCTNASNWAAYGDQHRGVALMFRPQSDGGDAFLPFTGPIGSSHVLGQEPQRVMGEIRERLEPVTYTAQLPELDFFQSLGNLPRRKVEQAWHANRAGQRSRLVDAMITDTDAWRSSYWASFRRVTTTKLEDWKHEEEHRIVLSSFLSSFEESGLVTYDFSCLAGVVFGISTPDRDAVEIMKQVAVHCERTGRKDFEFYRMAFHAQRGCLVRL